MKIKKMTARFGALDGRSLVLGDGLNILYAPNESGKSTWCAFLRTMLFGLNTAQRGRAGQKPDKIKYQPWSGAPMSGSMDLITPDGAITLRRWTERDSQPMQAFSATVTGTETPVYGLTAEDAGQALTGVSEAVFVRTAFIRQSGLEVSNDPELDRRISAIVSGGDEEVSYLEAEKRLKTWQRHRRSGKRGAIPELQESLDGTRRTLEEIRTHSAAAADAEEKIAVLEDREAEAVEHMNQARSEQRKAALAEMGEARRSVQAAEKVRDRAEDALRRAEHALEGNPFGAGGPEQAAERGHEIRSSAEELRRAAEDMPSPVPAVLPAAGAVIALLLALLLPWRALCAGIGGVMLLLTGAMLLRLRTARRKRDEALAERKRILDEIGVSEPGEIDGELEEYRDLWQRKEQAAFRLEAAEAALEGRQAAQKRTEARAVNDLDFVNGDNEAARAGRAVEEIRAQIAAQRERRAISEGLARSLGDPMALESELAQGERRYTELLRQEEAISLALETLAKADGELQQRLSPQIARKAAEYFSFLTDGRYDEVTLTRDLNAKARRAGDAVGWDLDYLSAGAKDQLYLALRLAVCDLALPGEDPCPIVLDDALVTFDNERMARALELMRTIGETRQVLLFTCHEREGAYFAEDPAVRLLTAT